MNQACVEYDERAIKSDSSVNTASAKLFFYKKRVKETHYRNIFNASMYDCSDHSLRIFLFWTCVRALLQESTDLQLLEINIYVTSTDFCT